MKQARSDANAGIRLETIGAANKNATYAIVKVTRLQKPKNEKKRAEIILTFACRCGAQHRLLLSLAEVQIFERAIYKRKGLENFKLRHDIMLSPMQLEGLKREFATKAALKKALKEVKQSVPVSS